MSAAFPERIYVTLRADKKDPRAEVLRASFFVEDCGRGVPVAVYELRSAGQSEFVETKLEQRADGSA